ncbi:hypothetical protein B0I37DRAFT_141847 [Chaetomium sp. MPI-CAGE-AT-0009]|nr:hypothetical protein B0I37DRAFT_141847 [Chaetomium sp. MPI-CAGE-AT-0009]
MGEGAGYYSVFLPFSLLPLQLPLLLLFPLPPSPTRTGFHYSRVWTLGAHNPRTKQRGGVPLHISLSFPFLSLVSLSFLLLLFYSVPALFGSGLGRRSCTYIYLYMLISWGRARRNANGTIGTAFKYWNYVYLLALAR